MPKVLSWFVAVLLLGGVLGARASPVSVAITQISVADGTDAPLQRDMTILIAGTHITAVGPSATTPVPPGARIIDGSGRYLIPGSSMGPRRPPCIASR